MSENKVVPFGKYKGQPVEVMIADRKYVDWLQAQAWFKDRFMDLAMLLSANQQAIDTPEHNAMQARYLDTTWQRAFISAVRGEIHGGELMLLGFETLGVDVTMRAWVNGPMVSPTCGSYDFYLDAKIELKPSMGDDYPTCLRQCLANRSNLLEIGHFESLAINQNQLKSIFKHSGISVVFTSEIMEWSVRLVKNHDVGI